jgi:hypothetical protein
LYSDRTHADVDGRTTPTLLDEVSQGENDSNEVYLKWNEFSHLLEGLLRRSFDACDTNKNGFLDRKEARVLGDLMGKGDERCVARLFL